MPDSRRVLIAVVCGLVGSTAPASGLQHPTPTIPTALDWASYGGDPGGARWSPLAQVTTRNVQRLLVAWRFSTNEASSAYQTRRRTSFEATPLVVNGVMYLSTPLGRVFALDAATGKERWRYNAGVMRQSTFGDWTSRGVSYWLDSTAARGSRCRARIFLATIDARLIALDATDGTPCLKFGDGGSVDLRMGLRNAPEWFSDYEVTSPPAVINRIVVVGSAVADNERTDAASGEVRGFDARTGALRWSFDPISQDSASVAWATWRGPVAHRTGAANAWSVIAADPGRDLVFIPTGSPSPDYYGGERLGDNHYANSVVAIKATTGKVVWAFQTVHHDLWDYDNASPPALVTVRRNGRDIPAVLQSTKTGMLFVLDRETGIPIVPVDERPVPASMVAGEEASPTQPFSTLPPLSPHRIGADEAFGVDSTDRAACQSTMSALQNQGIFTPPSLSGTLVVPSNIGGAHWGGLAFDYHSQLAIIPVNHLAAVVQLIVRAGYDGKEEHGWEYAEMLGTPYMMRRHILLSPAGVPCTPPPFGTLVAVNLETGEIAWRVPLGTPGRLGPSVAGKSDAAPALGSPNLGGPIVTAGGLVFIGATLDRRIRAYELTTGQELWSAELPAGGKATPMTYAVGGRQFVAIAAGGDGDVFGKADELVVFALPLRH